MSPTKHESGFPGGAPFLWPEPGDKAFVPGDLNRPGVANLVFLTERWHAYAEGFGRAAMIVTGNLDSTRGDEDRVAFAVLTLWRHYLELKIKALIPDLQELPGGPTDPVPVSHDLAHLWSVAEPVLKHMAGQAGPDLLAVREIVKEFHRADPTGQHFRYPFTTTGTSTVPKSLENLDLLHLDETMQAVANFFDACETMAFEEGQLLQEMRAEAAQIEAEMRAELAEYYG